MVVIIEQKNLLRTSTFLICKGILVIFAFYPQMIKCPYFLNEHPFPRTFSLLLTSLRSVR